MIVTLDPGFGNTKVCVDGKVFALQSAVAMPKSIGSAAYGMATHEATSSINLDGRDYVAGNGAWFFGEPIGNMDFMTLASEARKILFYAALSNLIEPDTENRAEMVIGLPIPLLMNQEESASIISNISTTYKTNHYWKSGNVYYNLKVDRLRVLAQPVGAYADWLYDDEFHTRKNGGTDEVAILDIGMNTLDLYVIQGSKVVERFIGGSKVGVRKLLDTMNGHGQDFEEIDYNLRMDLVRPSDEALKSWLNEILGQVEKNWPKLNRFSTIIPVGGGALILGDMLRNALARKGGVVYWPNNPVATNAIGLWKWAVRSTKKAKNEQANP